MNYERYIRSAQWKEKRDMRLAIDGHRCVRCGVSDERLEVHHKTYERFGAEEMADLETLCVRCHDVETDRMRRISYGKKFVVLQSGSQPLRSNEHSVVASGFDVLPELRPVARDGVEMFCDGVVRCGEAWFGDVWHGQAGLGMDKLIGKGMESETC